MRALLGIARAWQVEVEWHPLGDVRGYYEHDVRTITLNSAMTEALLRSTLAHELGHAHYGHVPDVDPRLRERHERLANCFAADLLIQDTAYAEQEALVGPHPGAIAVGLCVATYTVEVYQAMHRHSPARRRITR